MAEQEMIADIIAEMRIFKCRNLETGELELCAVIANYFADRLEAAWKRERAKIEADALDVGGIVGATAKKSLVVGDAAKLREALVNISKYADCAAMRQHDTHTQHYIEQIRKWAEAALAAPPRNCDKYATRKEAEEAFLSEACEDPCGNCTVRDSLVHECGINWLFAPAAEQEGGNDGNK